MSTRTQGIIDRASRAEKFSDVRWILGDGVLTNYMESYVDDTMKRNAIAQSRAGVQPKIVRKSPTKCCPWCDALVGTYLYPDDVPDDVYRRHDNCNCIVEFYPGDGKKQNVWSKKWNDAEPETLKERKRVYPRRATPEQLQERKTVGIETTPTIEPNRKRPPTPVDTGAGIPNDATEYYVSGDGMWINQYLRGRGDFGDLTADERKYIAELDKATNGKIKQNTLYRSVDADAVFGNMSQLEYENLRDALIYNDKSTPAQNALSKANRSKGQTITEKGFMSTTTDRELAMEWDDFTGADKPVVLELKTTNKTRGVDLSVYDKNVDPMDAQHEVLLARNQQYVIDSIEAKEGTIYVKAHFI